MLTLIKTSLLAVKSKALVWLIGAGVITAILGTIAWELFTSGRNAEKMKQVRDTLRTVNKEYKTREEVDALAASAARDRLLKRWSRR